MGEAQLGRVTSAARAATVRLLRNWTDRGDTKVEHDPCEAT